MLGMTPVYFHCKQTSISAPHWHEAAQYALDTAACSLIRRHCRLVGLSFSYIVFLEYWSIISSKEILNKLRAKTALLRPLLLHLYIIWEQCFLIFNISLKIEKSNSTVVKVDPTSFMKWHTLSRVDFVKYFARSNRYATNDSLALLLASWWWIKPEFTSCTNIHWLGSWTTFCWIRREFHDINTPFRAFEEFPFSALLAFPTHFRNVNRICSSLDTVYVSSRHGVLHLGPFYGSALTSIEEIGKGKEK